MFEIIGLIAFCSILHLSEPIILLKRFLGFKEENYELMSSAKRFIHRGLYCCLCSSFWFSMIWFGFNPLPASIVACGSALLSNKIGYGF